MAEPMSNAYCATPMGDGYCTMPPAAIVPAHPTAAHTSTAGIGDMDLAGVTVVLAVLALAIRWRLRARWAR